jgi:hypothetical protein
VLIVHVCVFVVLVLCVCGESWVGGQADVRADAGVLQSFFFVTSHKTRTTSIAPTTLHEMASNGTKKRRTHDALAEQNTKWQAEQDAKKAAWKASIEKGAPVTVMTESGDTPLKRPSINFVLDAGECLNFGATCHPCNLHTYFWFKVVHGDEAAAKEVDIGKWTPTYIYDVSHVKCNKCKANLVK